MAITLVGTVANNCDAVTGFNAGNITTDDPNVQGTGCIGLKATGATANELYTTTLTGSPYSFASAGGQFGHHIIIWLNSKSPLTATQGFQVVVGNGTSRGRWYVQPSNYTGGFTPRVINTAADFDIIAAGSWTTGGNPAQLTGITQVGGAINPSVSIMGNFNNIGVDQFTIGLGIRADAGTSGTPNTFETIRVQDQDTSVWGWCRRNLGAYVLRGKIYAGPESGTATSWLVDADRTIVFASERVATGFYEFSIRGDNTTFSITRFVILAEDPTTARWSFTAATGTLAVSDTDGVWQGADQITLSANTTLTSTKLINCNKLTQNSATLNGIAVLSANTTAGTAFIVSNNPSAISNSSFTFSAGHAIEITTTGTYTFTNNEFFGYGADGTNNAAVYNNSGGLVTLNVIGSAPTIRNGTGASTTIPPSLVPLDLIVKDAAGAPIQNARVAMYASATDVEIFNTLTDVNGEISDSYSYTTDVPIYIRVRKTSVGSTRYINNDSAGTITSSGFSVTITLLTDVIAGV